jgi:hypothetical protein
MSIVEHATETSVVTAVGRRSLVAALAGAVAAVAMRVPTVFADTTIADNLIVSGFGRIRDALSCGGTFAANGALPYGGAPMALKQIAGNNGIVVTDEGGTNRKDLFIGLDTSLSRVSIQAVQQGVAWLDTALNPSGGNVGIHTNAPVATLHVAGNEQVDGQLTVNGNLTVLGTKSRAVQTATHGLRKLYAIEAPENWFEDVGWAALSAGHSRVNLDAIFAETVDTHSKYAVFLTPLGDCNGLYVSALDRTGFEVRELQGGTSGVEFQYRVIAKSSGLERVRLGAFTPAKRGD